MKKVSITIPDNLDHNQEVIAIAGQLHKKMIGRDQKRIGNSVDVIDLKTEIIVTRKSTEKPIKMIVCPICETSCDESIAKDYFTNYGGSIRKKFTCSSECRDFVLNFLGSRASKSKRGLGSPFFR